MAEALPSQPCHDEFTCLLFIGFHGTVSLQVDETTLQQSKIKEEISGESFEESLGLPLQITALPLTAIGRGDGSNVTKVVAPTALGYSVFGSENSQFPRYIEAFINMVERSSSCLTDSDIARYFNSFDDKMYSFFDSRFNKQLHELQERFLARAPDDPAEFEKFDFTKNFVTFARNELSKCDVNTRMQVNRKSAGLYWTAHNDSCIAEKLYSPGTHANQCCLYFPGVDGALRERLGLKIMELRKQQRESRQPKDAVSEFPLCSHVSIEFSSDQKAVLTITFETGDGGSVKNNLWKGIPLNSFFRQIKRYLKCIFQGVEDFDGILNRLMSKTCVIDTACANFSVPVPGQHVSIIGFDNTAVRGAGASMLIDIHNDPTVEIGWWGRNINPPPPPQPADGAVTHSRHRLLIPRDLVSYVPSGLVCVDTIKSVEPIFEPTTGRVVGVVYTYHDGRQETIAREPQLLGAATDSMGGVCGQDSLRDNISDDEGPSLDGGMSLGRRKLLRNTRRGRYLRNKSKSKRDKKIRGLGVRRTRRKRTRRTLRR